MNKLKSNKLFALFVAISAIIIIAGIVLYGLLGFNTAQDKPTSYTIDVTYGATVVYGEVGEQDADAYLQEHVEEILKGFSYEKDVFEDYTVSGNGIAANQHMTIRYTFSNISTEQLEVAVKAINAFVGGADPVIAEGVESVAYHTFANFNINSKAAWRGAIAIAVGAIVALIYVAIRFGVSCGVAGLAICAHDALFTVAFFALTRIPVFGAAPLLYGAIAAFVSVALWTVYSIRVRSTAKDPESVGIAADELADKASASSWKFIICIAATLAVVVVAVGLIAAAGTRALVLPALLGVAVPVYSTLCIGPHIFVPIRKAFDKKRASRKGGYMRKKKKAESEVKD